MEVYRGTTKTRGHSNSSFSTGHTTAVELSSEGVPLLTTGSPRCKFGRIKDFKHWLPQIDPDDPKAQTWTRHLSRRPTALGLQLVLTVAVLITNVLVTAWFIVQYGTVGGVGLILQGSCSRVERLNSVLHFAINVLSTAILGASNFCMQILAAPTRAAVDRAHRDQKWFDIGVSSLRNLSMMGPARKWVWLLLCLSSGTLHLYWNSAVFSSFPFIIYTTAIVTDDYLDNDIPWNTTDPATRALQLEGRTFERLNKTACIERYRDPLSGAGDVVVVTTAQNGTDNGGSSLLSSFQLGPRNDWQSMPLWMCSGNESLYYIDCYAAKLLPFANNWNLNVGPSDDPSYVPVEYCLSAGTMDMNNWCGLHFSAIIMILVCAMNLVKVLGIGYTWVLSTQTAFRRYHHPHQYHRPDDLLVTVGDAMESFLNQPDDTTVGMCLASQLDLRKKGGWVASPCPWNGDVTVRKFKLASGTTWVLTILPWLFLIAVVSYLLASSLFHLSNEGLPIDLGSLWKYGMGGTDSTNAILLFGTFPTRASWHFWGAVSFANSWQLEISILYLLYNSLLTRLSVGVEWSHFGERHHFLRTSCPRGMQRSTFFLSLPFRYGIPLSVSLAMLHWFVSQSVFLAQSAAFTRSGERSPSGDSSGACFSSIAIICSLGTAIVLVLALIGVGFQKVTFRLPMVSTSSAAISAACHRPDGDDDASLLSVKWGVIPTDDHSTRMPGHCSFTTCAAVESPQVGHLYE